MAEAADTPQHRFFCHGCKSETNPKLPDFVCPRCESDFIEEVTEDSSCCLWSAPLCCLIRPLRSRSQMTASRYLQVRAALPQCCRAPLRKQSLLPSLNKRGRPGLNKGPQWKGVWTRMVHQFLADLFANNGNPGAAAAALSSMLQLHSNPGDYAWGQGGLDAVITELLGQLECKGPPPAEEEMISSLPTVCISQEQTDCRLQCPVCREEYSSGEPVRKLPCLHYFHSECIVPWLELHDTCPVCRKSLGGVDNSLPPTSEPPEARSIRTELQENQAI
ncbi:E3 ubiquitin-protein ligase RNF115 isoform X2 [Pseudoliparis swirei]|uniref:E3 ubiquitin-protein ligase RNF115 isoform X2 n=1 Tax=Pseudoliparis swirei TaxID=2059687 RepID=UPI0024BEF38D|nr:E3 ubiquitin-protein ligase RNF115 isoform X2 [Pseudoliparis swirei]